MKIPFTSYFFAHPWFLLCLILLPLAYWVYRKMASPRKVRYTVSTTLGISTGPVSWKVKYKVYLKYLLGFSYALMIVALARPQDTSVGQTLNAEGIDIVLSLDVSPSMDADDLKPTRLEAAKEVAVNFVKGRPNDRIGLVIFAAESFTQCPATIDHNVLIQQLEGLHSNLLLRSTAIGMGLASAVNNLRNLGGKSKVVILMTDGVNESGSISPETALEIAQMYGVRVYTIGVGSSGEAYMPMEDEEGNIIGRQKLPVAIDEALLKKIAANTGGRYFRATDNASLKQIYNEIDKLEKSKIEAQGFTQYKECYRPFLLVALLLLVLYSGLSITTFKSLT
jgi:Ca-activated chloride channel family protein